MLNMQHYAKKGRESFVLEIRSGDSEGKLLFQWEPEKDTIEIRRKGVVYRVQLAKHGKSGTYRIVEWPGEPPPRHR